MSERSLPGGGGVRLYGEAGDGLDRLGLGDADVASGAFQVTVGEPGRPTRGLNVVITGAGERAALLLERANHCRADADAEAELERQAEEAEMMEAAERGHEAF